MFTWCKKGYSDRQAEAPYTYLTTQFEANANCVFPSLNGPTRSSAGTPADKIDIDTYLRGQDRNLQPLCNGSGNISLSDEATWRWAEIQPQGGSCLPCAPTGIVSQAQLVSDLWEEEASKKRNGCNCGGNCGGKCNCSSKCKCGGNCGGTCNCGNKCKCEQPFQRNAVRPMCSAPGVSGFEQNKYKF